MASWKDDLANNSLAAAFWALDSSRSDFTVLALELVRWQCNVEDAPLPPLARNAVFLQVQMAPPLFPSSLLDREAYAGISPCGRTYLFRWDVEAESFRSPIRSPINLQVF